MQLVKYWAWTSTSTPWNNYESTTSTKLPSSSSSYKTSISSSVKPTSSWIPSTTTTHKPTTIPSSTSTSSSSVIPSSGFSTSSMPSLTSIVTTTLLTITTLVPTTTCIPQNDIFGPIEGLSQCAQTIIFTRLADSKCNPANFPCICDELARLTVGAEIARRCTASETEQYNSFFSTTCPNNRQPTQTPTSTLPSTSLNVSTPIPPVSTPAPVPIITGVPTPNTTNVTIPVGPFVNSTITLPAPTETTADVLIPTTDANGQPTTLTSQTVSPLEPTGPAQPGFTGAAGKVEVGFGYVRAGLMAGGIGIMGLVFAEL